MNIITRTSAATICLIVLSCSNDPVSPEPTLDSSPVAEIGVLDGDWHGSWGGGGHDGVVFQPVVAELLIEGDRVELSGFPDATQLAGTVRYDTDASRIVITAATGQDGQAESQVLEYTYDISGEQLTLTGPDDRAISLQKRRLVEEESTRDSPPVP